MAHDLEKAEWVKVEFYGRVPDGLIIAVDPREIAENLMKIFGFTHIDVLTVTKRSFSSGTDDIPQVPELGGAVGRRASFACKQGQHDLCTESGCYCRCHE